MKNEKPWYVPFNDIWLFDRTPRSPVWPLHSELLVIPVDLICHMTMFEIFFDSLGTPSVLKSQPWGMTKATEWKSYLICFVSFICENTNKVWYINLWNWPHPKVTSLTLAFWAARHTCWFDMPHDHVWIFFWLPGYPKCPKVPTLGHDKSDRMKILSDMFCIFHLWEHTQSLVYKSLKLTW